MNKILVIDDERVLWPLYRRELEREGYLVQFTTRGREGIELARSDRPDLVVLDIIMEDMDGLETLVRLLEDKRDLPVVIHTAFGCYRDNYLSWAADAYLLKSSDFSELKMVIRDLLKRAEATDAFEGFGLRDEPAMSMRAELQRNAAGGSDGSGYW